MTGEAVCMEIRKKYPQLPIIILTAKDGINDIVEGLNLGADDLHDQPFVADEFLARLKARLRTNNPTDDLLQIADLVFKYKNT